MTRNIIIAAVATVSLSACLDTDPIGPVCEALPFEIQSTQGDTITTATGLRFIETSLGSGEAVESCQRVTISYEGFLADGTLFDSGGFTFTPGQDPLIPGFEQGVITARVGGTRRLIIPPSLGYGSQAQTDSQGQVVIPANSTLVFDVEIIAVSE